MWMRQRIAFETLTVFPKALSHCRALPFPAVFAVATLPLFSASVTFPLKLGPLLQALHPTLASLPLDARLNQKISCIFNFTLF